MALTRRESFPVIGGLVATLIGCSTPKRGPPVVIKRKDFGDGYDYPDHTYVDEEHFIRSHRRYESSEKLRELLQNPQLLTEYKEHLDVVDRINLRQVTHDLIRNQLIAVVINPEYNSHRPFIDAFDQYTRDHEAYWNKTKERIEKLISKGESEMETYLQAKKWFISNGFEGTVERCDEDSKGGFLYDGEDRLTGEHIASYLDVMLINNSYKRRGWDQPLEQVKPPIEHLDDCSKADEGTREMAPYVPTNNFKENGRHITFMEVNKDIFSSVIDYCRKLEDFFNGEVRMDRTINLLSGYVDQLNEATSSHQPVSAD
jgi:hypothetical protein